MPTTNAATNTASASRRRDSPPDCATVAAARTRSDLRVRRAVGGTALIGFDGTGDGVNRGIGCGAALHPAPLFAMRVCVTFVESGDAAYLNMSVLLFSWNAEKFAATGSWVPDVR